MVDAQLSPVLVTRVETLQLSVTNINEGDDNLVIDDVLNVTAGFLLDASRITIATNTPDSPTACGAFNIQSDAVLWSTATPRLQYLTNNGYLSSYNTMFLGGSRSSPYYSSTFEEPYQAFVNQGGITNSGTFIWSSYFLNNNGAIIAQAGDIQLDRSRTTVLDHGTFQANRGMISLKSASLLASSNVFSSSSLTLSATNVLSDGVSNLVSIAPTVPIDPTIPGISPTNGNSFRVGAGGINMITPPGVGDLLGSTITVVAPENASVPIVWASKDLGNNVAGFANNGSLGKLVLYGGNADSVFSFSGGRSG